MHRLLAIIMVALIANSTASQAAEGERKVSCSKVPEPARAAFVSMFPNAVIKGCATETEDGKTAYEFTSTEGKIGRDVLFYGDGSLIVIEETVNFDKVPDAVRGAVLKTHPRRAIKLSEKVTRGDTVYYEFHLKYPGKDMQLVLDSQGNPVTP